MDVETLPRDRMTELQVARLTETVRTVAEHVPFYRDRFAAAGVRPSDIRSLADLQNLPFTEKTDLRDHYPFGFLAVPREHIVRVHASSGTTGKPVVAAYTTRDLDLWAGVMARSLRMAGVTQADLIHNAYGYGLFTGGLGVHIGAERLGASIVPISGGFTKRQVMLLEDFGASVLTCTPSYGLVIAEEARDQGVDVAARFRLRVGIFGAEPWTERIREQLESRLHLRALNIYGLTEIIGPGVAMECSQAAGMHIHEDVFLPEIVDPHTGAPLPHGEVGELVFTTLTKEGMPLIRYRTRDRTRLFAEPCACGRTLMRMDRILGRTDDMIVVRGVNVFPQVIEHVLLAIPGLDPHYEIIVERPEGRLDTLAVTVETSGVIEDHAEHPLRRRAEDALAEALGVSVTVRLAGPKALQRSEGKAKRVIDRRVL
jgi:phenylacetate-CoA ligase